MMPAIAVAAGIAERSVEDGFQFADHARIIAVSSQQGIGLQAADGYRVLTATDLARCSNPD